MLWYLRASLREVGLPPTIIDGTYLWRLLNATLSHEIKEQSNYHETNSESARRINHTLHHVGVTCFYIAFFILCVFLIGYIIELILRHVDTALSLGHALDELKSAMIFFTAGLPAMGAALAGIRVHGDFESSKERSDVMMKALKSLERDYGAMMEQSISLNETGELLIGTTRVMSEDVAAWQELHGRKRLTLPA